jgi:hypothetical protein
MQGQGLLLRVSGARSPSPRCAGQIGERATRGLARFFGDARAGLAYALRDRLVSRLLLVQGVASLAVGATGALLVVLAERHLGLPPSGFAWLLGAIGAGALVGPLIPNTLARNYRDARWLFVSYIIRGLGDVLIAVFTPLPVALLLLVVYGLNTSTGMVVFNPTVQGAVPHAVRGRVFTLLDVEWSAMRLLSLALGGCWSMRSVCVRCTGRAGHFSRSLAYSGWRCSVGTTSERSGYAARRPSDTCSPAPLAYGETRRAQRPLRIAVASVCRPRCDWPGAPTGCSVPAPLLALVVFVMLLSVVLNLPRRPCAGTGALPGQPPQAHALPVAILGASDSLQQERARWMVRCGPDKQAHVCPPVGQKLLLRVHLVAHRRLPRSLASLARPPPLPA